jgi:hypothetical protein
LVIYNCLWWIGNCYNHRSVSILLKVSEQYYNEVFKNK